MNPSAVNSRPNRIRSLLSFPLLAVLAPLVLAQARKSYDAAVNAVDQTWQKPSQK